jgi:hypothetical protein
MARLTAEQQDRRELVIALHLLGTLRRLRRLRVRRRLVARMGWWR